MGEETEHIHFGDVGGVVPKRLWAVVCKFRPPTGDGTKSRLRTLVMTFKSKSEAEKKVEAIEKNKLADAVKLYETTLTWEEAA